MEWDASEPKDPVHKAKLAKERKAIAAYCKRIESEEETESQVLLHSKTKTRTACKEDGKDSVAENSEADIYEKPEISEEKESMPHKALMIIRKKTKTRMFTLMMIRKKQRPLCSL